MIISISGLPGSGKTTVGKILAKKLGYDFFSMGDLRGKWAQKRGMTIDELNKLGEKEEWTDKETDRYAEKLGKENDNFVIDSWLAFHFIPHSFKVFLSVKPEEAGKRVHKDQRKDEKDVDSPEEAREMLEKRVEQSNKRYKKYYGLDFLEKKHYDLVLDTTGLTPEETADRILKAAGKRVKSENKFIQRKG